ncbi:RagB/SusD family nutrient uptake outer membrane protein (plasmid) [Pedobacter sp. BS3]|uniref:RagB/SusD family nutrient uptake outer membrane protein n=1 Tax=Pedobacter sp. BS3 TaxID=2567937 RepID=UPI0011EEAA10|nr:RagB/SusD family nutrient uptake outer membrane protein [Pedobacter sp. BS3]TZF86299.1 RagB/SusD family nutrient uptake outer membrane protein [Pedobacter sp. BS3]
MKNINQLSIALVTFILMLTTQSCEKFITHDNPQGVTDALWWNTETDAKAALKTVYAGIPAGTSGRNVMYFSGMSDEAVDRGDFKGAYDLFTRSLQDTRWAVALSIWTDDYIDIRRANRFLENVDKVYMDEAVKTRMKYEARALRAYYHMELMLLFGDIPLVTHSVLPNDNNLSRNPSSEVYSFIVSELTDCAQNLPTEYVTAEAWRISSGACWALLSRLALYSKDYELAKKATLEIINSNVYQLYKSTKSNGDSYAELFGYTGELNKERIFYSENGCGSAWTTLAPVGIGGETYISPTNTVVDNYETKQGNTIYELGADSMAIYRKYPNYHNNRDPRLEASVFYPGENFQGKYILDPFYNNTDKIGATKSTATGYWVQKYIDPLDQAAKKGTLDFMIIRYAEVLLNYTEALVELGDWQNPDVLKYLNEVRNRARMPSVQTFKYNTQDKLRTLIRRERQAELAFEGQRYFDIRRWGIVNDVMNGDVYGATNPQTGEIAKVQTRVYNLNRDFLWPIPQTEIDANPNMTQNPKY